MSPLQFAFHRLAAQEFRIPKAWYAQRSPAAADRFRDALDAATVLISRDPDGFPVMPKGCRSVRLRRFPFALIYCRRPRGDILIVAVAHLHRKPQYWSRRV